MKTQIKHELQMYIEKSCQEYQFWIKKFKLLFQYNIYHFIILLQFYCIIKNKIIIIYN